MTKRKLLGLMLGGVAVFSLTGCPSNLQFVAGGTGDNARLGSTAAVSVLSPATNLAIAGGTKVDVNWLLTATTTFSSVDVVFDRDQIPNNGNEIQGVTQLSISDSNASLDTSQLDAGTYFIGVFLFENNELAASDYATGQVVINQRAQFFFTSPRDNFNFDRSPRISPHFDVAWTLFDPDSTVTTQIFLQPDGNSSASVLLRESTSQTGDSFSFDLPTANFEPGLYRIVAVLDDGVRSDTFTAPGSIRIRSRLSSVVDLRFLGTPDSPIPGAVFQGFNPRDNNGSFVASLRDIDGDSFADFMTLSQFGKPNLKVNSAGTGAGEGYVVYGRAQRFSGEINLNSTGTLFRGEIFGGVPEVDDPIRPSRGITSLTLLSDWDSDGIREIAFGMPFTDSMPTQTIFQTNPLDSEGYFRSGGVVIFASQNFQPQANFPGRNVFDLGAIGMIPHVPRGTVDACDCFNTYFGPKAPFLDSHRGFYACLQTTGASAAVLGASRMGTRFSSNEFDDQFGETISAHEFDSLAISVPNRDPMVGTLLNFNLQRSIPGAGVISIFFSNTTRTHWPWSGTTGPGAGGNNNYPGAQNPNDLNLLPLEGPYHYILNDFAYAQNFSPIGARLDESLPGFIIEDGTPESGCTVRSLGLFASTPFSGNTLRIWSSTPGARLSNLKSIDDFSGDGLQDILLGAPLAREGAGVCYIMFGRIRELLIGNDFEIEEFGKPIDSSNPADVRLFDGIQIVGAPGSRLGDAQDRAGDFNGDGLPDVIIGSSLLNNRRGGAAILFGTRDTLTLTQSDVPFADIATRGLGLNFVGEADGDLAGARVAGVGDVDGDGLDDILICAPNKSVSIDLDGDGALDIDRTNCGVVYLVYGSSTLKGTYNLADIGTEALPGAVFVGRNSGDFLGAGLGEQGDRANGIAAAGDVDGDGRIDLIFGAANASPRQLVHAGESYLIYGEGD